MDEPQTIDIPGDELRAGDVVVATKFTNRGWYTGGYPATVRIIEPYDLVQYVNGSADVIHQLFRIRLPRLELASHVTNEDIRQRCSACGCIQHIGWALTNDAWKRLGLDVQKAYCIECAARLTSGSFSLSEIAFLSFNDTILIDTMPGTHEAAESQRDAFTSLAKRAIDWTEHNVDARKSQPDDNSKLTTVDVPGNELRVGDVVIGGHASGSTTFREFEPCRVRRIMRDRIMYEDGWGDRLTDTYRVRLPRPEVVNRCPGCGCTWCTDGCTSCEPKCPRTSVTASSEAARRDGA